MWTRILILAVLWLAIFRFVGRLIRFLAGPGGVPGRPAAPRDSEPNRATRAKSSSAPRSVPGEVIDVEFEDLTSGRRH